MSGEIIIGNWKMNGSTELVSSILSSLIEQGKGLGRTLAVAPPSLYIAQAAPLLKGTDILLGGQDCYEEEDGAFTGSVSAPMLRDVGCSFVILGHSERRMGFKESSFQVSQKGVMALNSGLKIVVCVGEDEAQRKTGKATEIVMQQLLDSIPESMDPSQLIVAYEPIWAIGTGAVAQEKDIAQMLQALRKALISKEEGFSKVPLLYGGSVKPENAADILAIEEVGGVLVGGASLEAQKFLGIAKAGL